MSGITWIALLAVGVTVAAMVDAVRLCLELTTGEET
jgi:hypothetical protein